MGVVWAAIISVAAAIRVVFFMILIDLANLYKDIFLNVPKLQFFFYFSKFELHHKRVVVAALDVAALERESTQIAPI